MPVLGTTARRSDTETRPPALRYNSDVELPALSKLRSAVLWQPRACQHSCKSSCPACQNRAAQWPYPMGTKSLSTSMRRSTHFALHRFSLLAPNALPTPRGWKYGSLRPFIGEDDDMAAPLMLCMQRQINGALKLVRPIVFPRYDSQLQSSIKIGTPKRAASSPVRQTRWPRETGRELQTSSRTHRLF